MSSPGFTDTPLSGLKIFVPKVIRDARGFFLESYGAFHRELGDFVQDNHSRSIYGTLRGLHYQANPGQVKLVRVARGRIIDVAVDIRPDSPTFGRWFCAELDDVTHAQLLVPVGFAHGFCVTSEVADVVYKVSSAYNAAEERSIRWNDLDLGIDWPISFPILSERDTTAESFADYARRVR